MLVVGIGLAGLRSQPHHLLPHLPVWTDKRSSSRRSDHLIAVETQHTIVTEGTQYLPFVARTEALGVILNDGDVVLAGNLHDAVNLIGHAIEGNGDDGFRLTASLGDTVLDGLLKQLGVYVPGVGLRVHKYWRGSQIGDRIAGGTESKALHHHLIAGLHIAGYQCQMYGGSA